MTILVTSSELAGAGLRGKMFGVPIRVPIEMTKYFIGVLGNLARANPDETYRVCRIAPTRPRDQMRALFKGLPDNVVLGDDDWRY